MFAKSVFYSSNCKTTHVSIIIILAYTMAKYGMSMCVLGMAGELKSQGIAVNALWPRTGKNQKQIILASVPRLRRVKVIVVVLMSK